MSSGALADVYQGKSSRLHFWGSSVAMLYIKLVSCSKGVRSRFLIPNSWKDFDMAITAQSVQLNQCWSQATGNTQEVACSSASGRSYFLSLLADHLSLENWTTINKGQRRYPNPFVSFRWVVRALAERQSWITIHPKPEKVRALISLLPGEQPDNFQASVGRWRPRIAKLMKSNRARRSITMDQDETAFPGRDVFWTASLFSVMLKYFMCWLLGAISTAFL